MKQGVNKNSELLKMSLQRSLKIINIGSVRPKHFDTARDLRSNLSQNSLRARKTSNNSLSLERKMTGTPVSEASQGSNKTKKLELQVEVKQLELENKRNQVKEKKSFIKQYELSIKKKEKELIRKNREFRIQSAGCSRMVAEGISKEIIQDIIWTVLFKSLNTESFSLSSRKQAYLSAFTKMKAVVVKLETLKRGLEKSALLLISQKQSLQNPSKK